MDCQGGQPILAGGDVAGRGAGQQTGCHRQGLRPVRSTDGAATRDYDEHDIEIRLGMGVHPLPGR
jgi:hypothetical protein